MTTTQKRTHRGKQAAAGAWRRCRSGTSSSPGQPGFSRTPGDGPAGRAEQAPRSFTGFAMCGSTAIQAHPACVPCLVRQAQEVIEQSGLDPSSQKALLRQVLHLMTELDWDRSPPELGQKLHCLLRHLMGDPDPYAAVKERLNERAEALYPAWHRRFQNVFPPLEAAVRLAIVGNLLDVGAKTQLSEAAVVGALEDALTAPLLGSVDELAEAIQGARNILYLADNAGEIVFDRDLLAQLPLGSFTLAVRGSPVLNDATLADAERAGLPDFCDVIPNGSDAPGTLLEDCSPAFRERFASADLILAKGQGNYESLAGRSVGQHVFFLLKVKCAVLAEALHQPIGSLVLHHQRPVRESQSTKEAIAP